MKRYLFTCLLAIAAACAQAGVGLAQIPGMKQDGTVTVFYPTAAEESPQKCGPFSLMLAPDNAQPVRGNGRLVVISHGSGGNPWVHSNLARTLVQAGFVVAMPEHHADNARDPSKPGPESWKMRPAEVSRAIDAVAADARFASLLALDKVGMYGMSAGGHTALTLAGGRWSPAVLRAHCDANLEADFSGCVGLATRLNGGGLDWLRKAIAQPHIRYFLSDDNWYSYNDPRIRAVVAGVPFASDFDAASLAIPRVPLALVTAQQDKWLVPRFHSDRIVAACKACELLEDMPRGGHGALLSPLPPQELLGETLAELLADAPGFDRSRLPEVDRKITAFFTRHLLP
jgi:predicted dienelactone hydrolase